MQCLCGGETKNKEAREEGRVTRYAQCGGCDRVYRRPVSAPQPIFERPIIQKQESLF